MVSILLISHVSQLVLKWPPFCVRFYMVNTVLIVSYRIAADILHTYASKVVYSQISTHARTHVRTHASTHARTPLPHKIIHVANYNKDISVV